jgi:hypothetical protein
MNVSQRGAVATGAAASGVAGATVVIVTWLLGLAHVEVPAEVAAALLVVLTPLLHFSVVRLGIEPFVDEASK